MSSSATPSAVPTVGLDIGGTKVLGVLLDAQGTVLQEQRRLSPHAGVDALVATSTAIVDDLAQPSSPVGVGVKSHMDAAPRSSAGLRQAYHGRSHLPS